MAYYGNFYQPSLILLLNARSIISLLGIITLVIGNWSWNREWDLYRRVEPVEGGSDEYQAMVDETPRLPPRFNKVAAIGWTLLAFSYLLEREQQFAFDQDVSVVLYLAIALIMAVGALQAHFVPQALLDGTKDDVKVLHVSIFFLSLLTDGFLNSYLNPSAPAWMGPIGALCIILAPYALFHARRKGEPMETANNNNRAGDMEEDGIVVPGNIPENRVYIFNLGGPATVTGWFLWWLSMNCSPVFPPSFYLQLFVTSRTYIAFVGAALVTLLYWMIGYALDATAPMNDKEDALNMVKNAPAFGAGTLFFGEADEIPVAMTFVWGVMGFATFWPYIVGWVPFVVFILFLVVGYSMAMQQTAGMREKDLEAVTRWGRCVDASILLSALAIAFYGKASAVVLMLVGLLCTRYGLLALHGDRKIGWSWLHQADATIPPMSHDHPQVFSYGALAFPFGMIALAWGLSTLPY